MSTFKLFIVDTERVDVKKHELAYYNVNNNIIVINLNYKKKQYWKDNVRT